jgi:hypothetical protein
MKNPELFNKTIGILVKAYQNDTLKHGDCCGCAFGNMVVANMGYSLSGRDGQEWYNCTGTPGQVDIQYYKGLAKQEIESTGYTPFEMVLIENAFESFDALEDRDGFKGLMSVCDALMQIHEATAEETESAKLQFVKA